MEKPMFQRRHYEWLAQTVKEISTGPHKEVALLLASRLAADNPNFDRERFLIAAGVTP